MQTSSSVGRTQSAQAYHTSAAAVESEESVQNPSAEGQSTTAEPMNEGTANTAQAGTSAEPSTSAAFRNGPGMPMPNPITDNLPAASWKALVMKTVKE